MTIRNTLAAMLSLAIATTPLTLSMHSSLQAMTAAAKGKQNQAGDDRGAKKAGDDHPGAQNGKKK